eukprot:2574596-Amphidinium_carterae.1
MHGQWSLDLIGYIVASWARRCSYVEHNSSHSSAGCHRTCATIAHQIDINLCTLSGRRTEEASSLEANLAMASHSATAGKMQIENERH